MTRIISDTRQGITSLAEIQRFLPLSHNRSREEVKWHGHGGCVCDIAGGVNLPSVPVSSQQVIFQHPASVLTHPEVTAGSSVPLGVCVT